MVSRLLRLVASLFLITQVATAIADTEVHVRPGMMGVADIGARDCATFNEMHYNGPAGMELHVLTWVQGYVHAMTGADIDAMLAAIPGATADGNNGWNFDTLTAVFVGYCRERPDARVSEAGIALYRMLAAGEPAPARD